MRIYARVETRIAHFVSQTHVRTRSASNLWSTAHGQPSYTQLWLRQGEESVTQPDPQLLEPPGQPRPGSIQRKNGRGGDERRCVVQG
ncbi:uncharacterized [Tachysurus ichikawai]